MKRIQKAQGQKRGYGPDKHALAPLTDRYSKGESGAMALTNAPSTPRTRMKRGRKQDYGPDKRTQRPQKSPDKPRKTKRNPEEPRRTQKKASSAPKITLDKKKT